MGKYGLLPRVEAIELYRRDVIVIREERGGEKAVRAKRREITYLSRASRQRLAFVACNTSCRFETMITLTYPRNFPTDGKLVKRHLNRFLQWSRRRWSGLQYLWFLEFQKRGAPHIHILLDVVRVADDIRDVASAWYEIVDSGDELHRRAGTRTEGIRKIDGAARYAVKYAMKTRQKTVPPEYRNVGRFWGMSKGVNPVKTTSWECDDRSLRSMLAHWKWAPQPGDDIYRILYGASPIIQQHLVNLGNLE